METKMKIADARKAYIDAFKKFKTIDWDFQMTQLGKKVNIKDYLYQNTIEIEAGKGCDEIVVLDFTTSVGLKIRFDLSQEIAKKLVKDLQTQLGELNETSFFNSGEETLYTVLDADNCNYTTGTIEEIVEYFKDIEKYDVSDLTIAELKEPTTFNYDEETV